MGGGLSGYTDLVREHFQNPRHAGEMPDPDAIGYETNPVCGDILKLSVRIADGSAATPCA